MKNILVTEFNGESNVLIYTETRSVQFVIDRLTQKVVNSMRFLKLEMMNYNIIVLMNDYFLIKYNSYVYDGKLEG